MVRVLRSIGFRDALTSALQTPLFLLPALLAILAGVPDVFAAESADRPNVMVITIDCLRADYLASYGFPRELAPEVTRLATEGVVFEHCTSQAPWTIPSMASMITGLYPSTNNVFDNIHRLSQDYRTMAEVFQDNGYVTGAFIAHSVIATPGVGLLQGFGDVNGGAIVKEKINFERLMTPLFEFLTDNRREPMFLWLHLMELHPRRTRGNTYLRTMFWYEAEIRYVSDHLARIFAQMKSLGIYDNTIIVFTADHGEHLGKPHNLMGHQQSVFEELLHIPLIIRGPGFPKGTRIPAMVELLDLMPTLMDRAGIDPATTLQGKNMMPLVEGKSDSIREFCFAERYYNRYPPTAPVSYHHLAVLQYPWKIYVKVPCSMTLGREPLKWIPDQKGVIVQLFNLETDFQEMTDVSSVPENQDILNRLKTALSGFRDQQEKLAALGGSILDDPSQEVQSLLENLGYLGRK